MSTTFKKHTENFFCDHCGCSVQGSGYTNHCPKCLWSKHVDIHPGDRLQNCAGAMVPIRLEMKKNEFILVHECLNCAQLKRNKISSGDDLNAIFSESNKVR